MSVQTIEKLNLPISLTSARDIASDSSNSNKKDIKALTSLRLVPALAVILYHAAEYFRCWHGIGKYYVVAQAVTFFFILSGFLLTINYFNLQSLAGSLKFYLARITRIWPAHVFSLCLLLLLIPEIFKLKVSDTPIFLSNLFLIHAWIPIWKVFFSYNSPSWSNSTELFFYICFPFLLFALRKHWSLPLLSTLVLTLATILFANYSKLPEYHPLNLSLQGLIYINPYTNILNFASGMVAAICWKNFSDKIQINRIVGTVFELTVLLIVCFLNPYSTILRVTYTPILGNAGAFWLQNAGPSILAICALIFVFALQRGYISKIISHPSLVLLGDLSFGTYMLHGVFLAYLGVNFPKEQPAAMAVLFLIITFIAAYLMSELFEKPLRNLVLRRGNRFIDLLTKNTQELPTIAATMQNKKNNPSFRSFQKNYILVPSFSVLLICLIYAFIPSIHKLNMTETQNFIKSNKNQIFIDKSDKSFFLNSKLACLHATVSPELNNNSLRLRLLWKSLKEQNMSFRVQATILDKNENYLSSLSYLQDGRFQRTKAEEIWLDDLSIPISSELKNRAAKVHIAVYENKRKLLLPTDTNNRMLNYSFAILI